MCSELINLAPFDGELFLIQEFYSKPEANRVFSTFLAELAWQEELIFIYGRWCQVPRLTCWYGDPEATYCYSRLDHQPKPWTTELQAVRLQLERQCGCLFNSVLGNLYRNGQDSMGCHADDEKELGINPIIASLSLGDERLFKLKHCNRQAKLDIQLGHGDLLIMAGTLQHHWQHSLPKTRKSKSPRINLTFRNILPP